MWISPTAVMVTLPSPLWTGCYTVRAAGEAPHGKNHGNCDQQDAEQKKQSADRRPFAARILPRRLRGLFFRDLRHRKTAFQKLLETLIYSYFT